MYYDAERNEDEFCCGMRLYGNFSCGDRWSDRVYQKPTVDGMVAELKLAVDFRYGGYATVNTEQKKEGWYDALRKVGFKEAGHFINPNSSVTVYIMIYTPKRTRKPVTKKRVR